MRNKSVVLLAIALGCGMIASVGISQVVMSGGGAAPTESVEIYVATMDIPRDSKIAAEMIRLEKWPAGKQPAGSIQVKEELKDKFAKQQIYGGEPLLTQKLVDATERKTVGITAGHTLVTYNISNDPGIGNLIEPKDRVNVIGFFEKSDLVPETTHRDVLRNVKIFAIDGRTSTDPENKPTSSPSNVVLEINKADEKAWNWAQKFGSLRLTLGNPNDQADFDPSAPNQAAQEFIQWIEAAQIERANREAANAAPEPEVETSQGGPTMQIMTPSGLKVMQWNERTGTFTEIANYSNQNKSLGSPAGGQAPPPAPSTGAQGGFGDPSVSLESEEFSGNSFRTQPQAR